MINLLHNYSMNINDGFCTFMLNFKNVLQYTVKNQHFQRIGVMKSNSFGLGFTIDVLLRLRTPLLVEFRFLDCQNNFKEYEIVN